MRLKVAGSSYEDLWGKSPGSTTSRCIGWGILPLLVGAALLMGGCVGPFANKDKPSEICLQVEASTNLNAVDGEAQVVVLKFYPLLNEMAFNTTDANDLLDGVMPSGMTGDAWEATVHPGQSFALEEKLPRDTLYLGILADFFDGPQTLVVEADCDLVGNVKLILSSKDLQKD